MILAEFSIFDSCFASESLRKLDESWSLGILLKLNLCLSLMLENEITLLTGQTFRTKLCLQEKTIRPKMAFRPANK